jgi:hypothetical protein
MRALTWFSPGGRKVDSCNAHFLKKFATPIDGWYVKIVLQNLATAIDGNFVKNSSKYKT